MITVRFNGHKAVPKKIKIGVETDNQVEHVLFQLPQIGANQQGYIYVSDGDGHYDVVALSDEGEWDVTRNTTQAVGKLTAFVRVVSGNLTWNSEPLYVTVVDLPDIEEDIEQAYPSAIQTALDAVAGAIEELGDADERLDALEEEIGAAFQDRGAIPYVDGDPAVSLDTYTETGFYAIGYNVLLADVPDDVTQYKRRGLNVLRLGGVVLQRLYAYNNTSQTESDYIEYIRYESIVSGERTWRGWVKSADASAVAAANTMAVTAFQDRGAIPYTAGGPAVSLDTYTETGFYAIGYGVPLAGVPDDVKQSKRRALNVLRLGGVVLQRLYAYNNTAQTESDYIEYIRYESIVEGVRTWRGWVKSVDASDIGKAEEAISAAEEAMSAADGAMTAAEGAAAMATSLSGAEYSQYDGAFVLGDVNRSTGELVTTGINYTIVTPELIDIREAGELTVMLKGTAGWYIVMKYDENGQYTGHSGWKYREEGKNIAEACTVTPEDAAYIRVSLRKKGYTPGDPDCEITDIAACRNMFLIYSRGAAADEIAESRVYAGDGPMRPIAHRGLYGVNVTQESTSAAYIRAKELGYKYAETDLMITSDGKFVLAHEDDLWARRKPTGISGSWKISEHTLAEAKALNFDGESILTLEEFLTLCQCLGMLPVLDTKGMTQAQVNALCDLLEGMEVYSINGSVETLDYMLARRPEQRVRRSYPNKAAFDNEKAAYEALRARRRHAEYHIAVEYLMFSSADLEEVIAYARENGLGIIFADINMPQQVERDVITPGRYYVRDIIVGDNFNPAAYTQTIRNNHIAFVAQGGEGNG